MHYYSYERPEIVPSNDQFVDSFLNFQPVHIQWNRLDLGNEMDPTEYVKGDMWGEARPGCITAITGSYSIALLEALGGRRKIRSTDSIFINGKSLSFKEWPYVVGYKNDVKNRFIEYDFYLHPYTTVKEAIDFSLYFRGKNTGETIITFADICRLLGLDSDSLAKSFQILNESTDTELLLKTALALQVIKNPPLIIICGLFRKLDEFSSQAFIKLLRRIAKNTGISIIINFERISMETASYIDDMIVLSRDCTSLFLPPPGFLPFTYFRAIPVFTRSLWKKLFFIR